MRYFLSIILLLVSAITSQYYFDQEHQTFTASAEYQPLVAGTKTYENFNLGLQTALADVFWLDAIQYYGGWRNDHNYQKLADYLELTTSLDPEFSYPYAFAALILPAENIPEGYTIAEKGITKDLNDWQIPYFLATANHIYKKDTTTAAKYFDLAARTPGAPDNLKYVSAAYNSAPDNRQTIETVWQAIYENTNDQSVKDRAQNYLIHYQIMDLYDQAALKYQQKIGSWPKTLNDLITANILRELPNDPFGFTFQFNDDGKIRLENNQ